ncbi:uncharacterized protein LOC128234719 [Mya arenaria]|uniref:uncharacterized protein LOC128234719 n=1 Tax=Mya arenaria TaxID=6604 RepID=UPI0022E2AF77|nr:uncharacterized protein LOC128234719 [Mya arenaria]
MGALALLGLVIAYMFFLRELKYGFIQWIVIGLCFGIALFSLIGMIVYGACETDSSRLSSSYGLTFCAFLGASIAGAVFLWDKIDQMKGTDASKMSFRGVSSIPGSRGYNGRMLSSRSRPGSRSGISQVTGSTRIGATANQLQPTQEQEVEVNN